MFDQTQGRWIARRPDSDAESNFERRRGTLAHAEIEEIKRHLTNEMIGKVSDYDVEHVGHGEDAANILPATRLRVSGEPLRCSPDLVLKHRRREHVIIVERKTTRKQTYLTGSEQWDNIEAQLWCYSLVDQWAQVERITLVGEIWRRQNGWLTRAANPMVWYKGEDAHHCKCLAYFKRYGGVLSDPDPSSRGHG